jgi:2-oxo-4-hydroxy-4-carboxy-5-ureidoimidazoline decarboxylase
MTITEFNALPEESARARLLDCCAANRWVSAMLAERPFQQMREVERAARLAWDDMCEDDWLEAFSAHPRIGDLDSLREKYASTRELAGGEQSMVGSAGEALLTELARLNAEYEDRFGFIFIVFASGKSATRILDLLRSRIGNSRDQELRNAASQQLEITLLRLKGLLS